MSHAIAPRLLGTGVRLGIGFNTRHGNQCESEIAHLHQRSIERRLISHSSCENRFSVIRVYELEAIKPIQPALVELAFDSKFVGDRGWQHARFLAREHMHALIE